MVVKVDVASYRTDQLLVCVKGLSTVHAGFHLLIPRLHMCIVIHPLLAVGALGKAGVRQRVSKLSAEIFRALVAVHDGSFTWSSTFEGIA